MRYYSLLSETVKHWVPEVLDTHFIDFDKWFFKFVTMGKILCQSWVHGTLLQVLNWSNKIFFKMWWQKIPAHELISSCFFHEDKHDLYNISDIIYKDATTSFFKIQKLAVISLKWHRS